MSTYAISDLHGQYDIFEKLLDVIDFSENDFLYVLGDAIDRGPDGIKILQKINQLFTVAIS
ncbi:Calcineurin-like phosphoesterase [Butyrivibrio proteoclasticus]|uniref:Calcineurin-like phosphoesterase n=1 Tax=Butyrivibrio proteoclasticus TaxID=43305 RepID=A0A1I5XUG8_9FIRM|nr:metallophosphoesterase [Butyrivibrio proteoclasticus]SFQ35506.1 Calcineurin-like phosphoesterase [Butyrivibrio proteoclasticus]